MTALAEHLGAGPLNAPLWIIGRDYGAHEHAAQQPFLGPAGDVLNEALRAAGITRHDIRIDNLVPKQPPANDFARHNSRDVAWGKQRLAGLLQAHKPRVIVALGNESSAFLVGDAWPHDEGIQGLRGYLWDSVHGRVLSATHPAAILREWTPWRALLDFDMRKAKNEATGAKVPLATHNVHVVTSPRDAIAALSGLAGAVLLAVDIENTHDLRLACVGFAANDREAFVVPAHEAWQLALIRELCESATPKVLQNGQYDRMFLRRFAGIELRNQTFDTQLAWHVLNPELAGKKTQVGNRKAGTRRTVKSLKFLASIYTRVPFYKDYAFQSDMDRYVLCGKDCCVTWEVADKQRAQLEVA